MHFTFTLCDGLCLSIERFISTANRWAAVTEAAIGVARAALAVVRFLLVGR